NADRLLNRHLLLPRVVRCATRTADFVHVVDHSYAHVVSAVPPGRVGVYCHDLDAFRSILDPDTEPRPWWFRRLARRTLRGLQRAAVVFHSTLGVREQILRHGLVEAAKLVHAPYGVAAEFTPGEGVPREPFVLHVGANIPRKRLDVLLDVFAAARVDGLRLVQVGGPWPPHLAEQIERLKIGPFVTQARDLSRGQLADLYRRAAVVLVPSGAEGFGLPVIEALACGASVVASDIPTLREAGGGAVTYCPVGAVGEWAAAVSRVLNHGDPVSSDSRLSHAAKFTWAEHARVIAGAYLALRG
ncbi:MAG TPA: glycosyltransferase, partial [Gemmataceae bacterium]|nr:glycosyltransferase [Gemmataceae bacterium]